MDQLMGKNRNMAEEEKALNRKSWKDIDVCAHYLSGFCPNELFVNTKSDLGLCRDLHDDELRTEFLAEPDYVRLETEEKFLRYLSELCETVDHKIRRGTNRLAQTVEPDRENPEYQERAVKIKEIDGKLKELIEKMESLAEEGDVDESLALTKDVEALQTEKTSLVNLQEAGQRFVDVHEKAMEVCETCGSFLISTDTDMRLLSHMNGKQHIGYKVIRAKAKELRERLPLVKRPTSGSSSSPSRRDSRTRSRSPPNRGGRSRDRDRDRDRGYDRDRTRSSGSRRSHDYRSGRGSRRDSYDSRDRRGDSRRRSRSRDRGYRR